MYTPINFSELYGRLLTEPEDSNREFILSGYTYKEVFKLAAGIRDAVTSSANTDKGICLCSDDKAVILASLLSALTGGPPIILPHSFSERVIIETRDSAGFSRAITDHPHSIPAGIDIITPEQCVKSDSLSLGKLCDPDSIFLHATERRLDIIARALLNLVLGSDDIVDARFYSSLY